MGFLAYLMVDSHLVVVSTKDVQPISISSMLFFYPGWDKKGNLRRFGYVVLPGDQERKVIYVRSFGVERVMDDG